MPFGLGNWPNVFEFQFASVAAFLAMTPHGAYVWPVYLLGLLIICGLSLSVNFQHRKAIRQVQNIRELEKLNES